MSVRSLALRSGGTTYEVRLEGPDEDGRVTVSGTGVNGRGERHPIASFAARASAGPGEIVLTSHGKALRCHFARDGRGVWVACRGRVVYLEPEIRGPKMGAPRHAPTKRLEDEVRAPMTGTVVEVRATSGQAVADGDVIAVIEAMKMEYRLTAPREGRVEKVCVHTGERVELGAVVARLASEAP